MLLTIGIITIYVLFYLFIFFILLYIYPPDSQESDGGAIHRVSNYPDYFRRCQDIAVR